MQRIGIYGGTFDPIHHAHLILARDARETFALDEVIFIPAAISPHKLAWQPTAPAIRAEMVRAAIADVPGFTIDECELHRPGPSYTIDTVHALQAGRSAAEWFYFIGEDNVPLLETWHCFAELETLVRFVVMNRSSQPLAHRYPFLPRRIDISATEIRNRVASGRSLRYLVPMAVEELIKRHQLYRTPTHRT